MLLMGMEILLTLTTPMVQIIDVERDVQWHFTEAFSGIQGFCVFNFGEQRGGEEYWDWDEDAELGGSMAAISTTVGNVIPYCSSPYIYTHSVLTRPLAGLRNNEV